MKTILKTSLVTIFSLTLCLVSFAQSDLSIEMKMSSDKGVKGNIKIYISAAGTKTDMTMNMPQMPNPINYVMLIKKSNPDVAYKIDNTGKTYSEIDLKKATSSSSNSAQYKVTKLGEENIMGYNCMHIKVTAPDGNISEIWNTKDIAEYAYYKKLSSADSKHYNSDMEKAIEAAGADGFPVKRIMNMPHQGTITTELVKVDKTPLSASLFTIPDDYKKTEFSANPYSNGMSKEDAEKMREQMMKQYGGQH